jgi:quercetin dioxygenase-like cupin family protein
MDDDRSPLPFADRRLSPRFERRAVVIAPGCARAYHEAEWRDAIVIVESGQIELELVGPGRPCFERGDVLWLDGLPLRALHNRGSEPAVLVAVARRRPLPRPGLPTVRVNRSR